MSSVSHLVRCWLNLCCTGKRHPIRPESLKRIIPDQVLAHLTNRSTSTWNRKQQMIKESSSCPFLEVPEAPLKRFDSSLPVKVSRGGDILHTLSFEEGFLDPKLPRLQSREKSCCWSHLKPLLLRKLWSVTFSLKLIVVPSYSISTSVPQRMKP